MSDFPKRLRIWIRWTVIWAQRYTVLRYAFRWACRLGTWQIGRLLIKTPGVEAVYLRHTHPNSPSFVPGHSDLDVTIVLSEDAARNPDLIEAVASKVETRSSFHYYLNPQDARLISREELAHVTRNYASPLELHYTPDDWILIAGREVRTEKPCEFPARELPWHPEFHKWWKHILQDYLLTRIPRIEDQYLRVFYRSTLKQQLYFMAALGKETPKPCDYLDDRVVEVFFREKPELQLLLANLKHSKFWDKDAKYLKERIFLHVLELAAEFFQTFPFHPKVNTSQLPPQEHKEPHIAAYKALGSRLDKCRQLTTLIKGVLTYPIPHCHPYFYQVDIVLPDGISLEQFSETVSAVNEAFKRREFHLDGRGFTVALVLESIYNWPLVFLGSPFPFLNAHIRRYGKCLMGPVPKAFEGALCREDLIAWCRVFLPYYMLNMSHRIEYSSRTINFCQLASIRLFLETGEMETDPLVLRERHREQFKYESQYDHVWSYVLKDKPGRQKRTAYKAALSSLLLEFQRVETLLAENHSKAVCF
jgi:hypothetical protein